jgi:predicted RNase H-like HicB family nuclease
MKYEVVIERAGDNLSAYVPGLPGCIVTGNSVPEVEQLVREAISFHLEGLREDGIDIQSSHAPFSMSSLPRNLIEAKANIQIQKTGAESSFYPQIPARF